MLVNQRTHWDAKKRNSTHNVVKKQDYSSQSNKISETSP